MFKGRAAGIYIHIIGDKALLKFMYTYTATLFFSCLYVLIKKVKTPNPPPPRKKKEKIEKGGRAGEGGTSKEIRISFMITFFRPFCLCFADLAPF